MNFDPEIRAYYDAAPEAERLNTGCFQLEFERTKELLLESLPKPPATILDVGGGPGTYAAWLTELGYNVHLIDPVERHIEQAKARNLVATLGDARELKFADQSADAVLELGPLYHLINQQDRQQALRESFRVLKPGGPVFVAAISRFASTLDGLARDFLNDDTFRKIVDADLTDGIHRNKSGKMDYFTTSNFHRPEELHAEVAEAGFSNVRVVGIEGPGWMLPDFDKRWADPQGKADLMSIAKRLESEPSMQGVSAHLMAVGWKN